VAAALRRDPGLQVETVRGGLGELRVSVDGQDLVTTNRLLYPRPGRLVEKVRARLKELTK
jgi:hypothetical protein